MHFLQLSKSRLLSIMIFLVIFFVLLNCFVKAEVDTLLPGEKNVDLTSNAVAIDTNDTSGDSLYSFEQAEKEYPADEEESTNDITPFLNNEGITLKDLALRVFYIVLALIAFLIFIKLYIRTNNLKGSNKFLDFILSKIQSNITGIYSASNMKLRQTLMLIPGQNLYLIEVDGKNLLIGGTHEGGVQFLTNISDLSDSGITLPVISEPKAESLSNSYTENPFLPPKLSNNENKNLEQKPENISSNINKHPFKRRTNFRQSLLSHSGQGFK